MFDRGKTMSNTLLSLERRFEVRALYSFHATLVGISVVAILHRDWWLLGICVTSFFLNGLIGQGLHKNKNRSFSQLAGWLSEELKVQIGAPNPMDFKANLLLVKPSANKFTVLVMITAVVIVFHIGATWWLVIATALAAYLYSGFMILSVFKKVATPRYRSK